MCGHVGVVGPVTFSEEKIFNQMLVFDSVRGTDSTGIAVVPRIGEVKIAKELGDPYLLFDTKRHTKAMAGSQRCIIGHNRYATVGNVSNKNAHPFEFATVVGAHNGTLTSKWKLEDAKDFSVDSENLFHHIDKKGLKDALNFMAGAWALVWWDKVNESINFLRNKERPLYWAMTEDRKFMYWASEVWMIQAALGRNNVKFSAPEAFKEDVHYSIPVDMNGVLGKAIARNAHATYTPPPVYVPFKQGNHNGWGGNTLADKVTQLPVKEPEVKKEGVVPETTSNQISKSGYAFTKGVRIELLDCCSDRNGAPYFACFDDSMPAANIRLYYKPKHVPTPNKLLGEEIYVNIGEMKIDGSEGMYYKVVGSSVDWDNAPWREPVNDAVYPGHDGTDYDMNDWIGKYGDCAWCSSAILPTDKHAMTTEGQCLCSSCVSDPEVGQYVQLSGGVRN